MRSKRMWVRFRKSELSDWMVTLSQGHLSGGCHLPRSFRGVKGTFQACFYTSLYKCFRGPSTGKLLLETEEDNFREGMRVHGLLANVLAMRKSTTSLPRASAGKTLPQTFRELSVRRYLFFLFQHLHIFAWSGRKKTPLTRVRRSQAEPIAMMWAKISIRPAWQCRPLMGGLMSHTHTHSIYIYISVYYVCA